MPTSTAPLERSTAEVVFPESKHLFQLTVKPLEEIKTTCIVILDTNVLLVPYTINPKGLDEISKSYHKLAAEKRLIIPGQVAREFAKHRAIKLAELHQQLSIKLSKITSFQLGKYPLLENFPESRDIVDIESRIEAHVREYKKALTGLIDRVRAWRWNDPVSLLYASLFTPEIILEPDINKTDLDADIKRRIEYKIPPGYKDASKDDLGAGDILIWHTILKSGKDLQKDVIFVSGDEKTDWFHQSDRALYPRFELVEEFGRKCGPFSFHILRLSDFLSLFDVEPSVVQEVRTEENKTAESSDAERRAFSKERSEQCEYAVLQWLAETLNNCTIDSITEDGFDMTATQQSGNKLRVEIRSVQNTIEWMPRIVRMTERFFYRTQSIDGDAMICLVADDKKSASLLAKQFGSKLGGPPSKRVSIGWLDESNAYSEFLTFNFA